MRRLTLYTSIAYLGVFAGALTIACGGKPAPEPPPPREVEVLELKPSTVRDTGEYLGVLISRRNVNVLPQVSGYVRRIHVKPGDKVTAGQTLIEIDARQESAALESAQAQQVQVRSNLELARQTLQRTQALYQEGLVSAQELERAQAAADAAAAGSRSAAAQVSQRQVQLQYFGVRAPFEGTVGDVVARLGDFVTATTVLTTVAQGDVLEVTVSVPAERAGDVAIDTPLELLDPRGEVVLSAPVFFVGPQADPRTQLVEVKAAFRNTPRLRPNELVRARLIYRVHEALQIPALGVIRQSGQPFVFVVTEKDGKTVVNRRPVTLGALGERAYVVEGGMKAGERVALSSLQALRDGSAIQPKAVESPGSLASSEAKDAADGGIGGSSPPTKE